MSALSFSFISMEPFETFSWYEEQLTREKYCFYYQRTTNSARREKENKTLQKAGLDLAKLVRGGINLKKT